MPAENRAEITEEKWCSTLPTAFFGHSNGKAMTCGKSRIASEVSMVTAAAWLGSLRVYWTGWTVWIFGSSASSGGWLWPTDRGISLIYFRWKIGRPVADFNVVWSDVPSHALLKAMV